MNIVPSTIYSKYPAFNRTIRINTSWRVFDRLYKESYCRVFRTGGIEITPLRFQTKLHIDTRTSIYASTSFNFSKDELVPRKRAWSLNLFNVNIEPFIVETILNRSIFSKRGNDTILFVQDMPIKMRGSSNVEIPAELGQFFEAFDKIINHERLINPDFVDYYAYVCVDQRPVNPDQTQRRPGAYSTSFPFGNVSKGGYSDSVYVIYDSVPIEFCRGNFRFDSDLNTADPEAVEKHFEERTKSIKTYQPYQILMLDSGHVCREGRNETDSVVNRTFLKVIFSKDKFNCEGNTHNFFFDYSWLLTQRKETRNPSVKQIKRGEGYADFNGYEHIDKHIVKELFESNSTPHRLEGSIVAEMKQCTKDVIVIATLPEEGVCGNYPIKLTKVSTGVEYLLPLDLVKKYYVSGKYITDVKHICDMSINKKRMSIVIQHIGASQEASSIKLWSISCEIIKVRMILTNISIDSPWYDYQTLSAGDYLIQRYTGEIYGITKETFLGDHYKPYVGGHNRYAEYEHITKE